MKIRPSLKLYFFISVVMLGSVMALGFSLLSVNYFVDGLDKGITRVMMDVAKTTDVEDAKPQNVVGFNIASRWQDTPAIIQQRFGSAPTKRGEIHKLKDQDSIFSIPENLYFLVLFENAAGDKRYVSRVLLDKHRTLKLDAGHPKNRLFWTFFTMLIAIALFSFFLVVIMQKIAKPIESLKNWAKALNQDNIQNSPPDFIYNELNVLASIVQSSLISAHQGLDREQRFLSYASHELRTPISVIRSNVDLLQRLSEKAPLSDKQQLTLKRIERAGLTMSDLTDTLLWLSRSNENVLTPEPIELDQKINQLSTDLNYLLNAKDVEVIIETDQGSVQVEAIACHIVLSNLIRNAYQHTQLGQVHIKQQGKRVTIINSNNHTEHSTTATSKDNEPSTLGYGYGLGLQLSERVIKRHGWFYQIKDEHGRYHVSVDFGANNDQNQHAN